MIRYVESMTAMVSNRRVHLCDQITWPYQILLSLLEGHITSQTETSYCAGERHGFYRDLDPTGKEVRSLGRFVRGERRGVQWKRVQGDAFFVGYVDENNNCIYSTTYLYPDLGE